MFIVLEPSNKTTFQDFEEESLEFKKNTGSVTVGKISKNNEKW